MRRSSVLVVLEILLSNGRRAEGQRIYVTLGYLIGERVEMDVMLKRAEVCRLGGAERQVNCCLLTGPYLLAYSCNC